MNYLRDLIGKLRKALHIGSSHEEKPGEPPAPIQTPLDQGH